MLLARQPVAAILVVVLAGCSPALDWREWQAAEPGVTLMFPCKPVRQQRTLALQGREQRMVLEVCDTAGASWALAYVDVQDPAAVTDFLRTLSAAAQGNLGVAPAAGAEPAGVPGATPNAAGGRFRINGRLPDGQQAAERLLVFAKGTWAVQVTALGRHLTDDAASTFIDSVRADR